MKTGETFLLLLEYYKCETLKFIKKCQIGVSCSYCPGGKQQWIIETFQKRPKLGRNVFYYPSCRDGKFNVNHKVHIAVALLIVEYLENLKI